jgi:hypothetical protein
MADDSVAKWMIRLSSDESRGGESESDPLGLGFASFGVGGGGSAL